MPDAPDPAGWRGGSFLWRPPRRPRRLEGSSADRASSSESMVNACARTAASSDQPSGLSALALSSSASRSSGVRARRAIRWLTSLNLPRIRAADTAPNVLPSRDGSSAGTGGGGDAGGGPWGRCGLLPFCGRGDGGSARVTTASRESAFQSKLRSGWVCSSASLTSASKALRPTLRLPGDRKMYSTRGRGGPDPGRPLCMT
jgi:hypothetical protein